MSSPEPPRDPWGDASRWVTPPQQESAGKAPESIRTAVSLMYAGAALTVLSALVDLIAGDTGSSNDDQAGARVAGALVGGAIVVGLWCWMAAANGQGKPWARTTATVFGCINVMGAVATGITGSSVADVVISITSAVLAVVILVLLYKPESSRYYEGY